MEKMMTKIQGVMRILNLSLFLNLTPHRNSLS